MRTYVLVLVSVHEQLRKEATGRREEIRDGGRDPWIRDLGVPISRVLGDSPVVCHLTRSCYVNETTFSCDEWVSIRPLSIALRV